MARTIYNPGRLAHRVELQNQTISEDGVGGSVVNWTTLAFLWARVSPTRQSGRDVGDHLGAEITHEVLIRHRDSVAVGNRFLFQNRELRILSCVDFEAESRFLTCLCEEEK